METQRKRLQAILAELYKRIGEANAEALAANAVSFLSGNAPLKKDIPIRLIKGGTYKIKGYYLENSRLHDIRGASAVITEVQERIVPDFLQKKIGFDSILYNGGGNLFALVPADCDADLGYQLEAEAQRYLLTANTAYFLTEEMQLSELLGRNYKSIVMQKESQLNERKKTKVLSDTVPKSEFLGGRIMGDVLIDAGEFPQAWEYCDHCRKRLAYYKKDGNPICGGCLHKVCVGGAQKRWYIEEYADHVRNHQNDTDLKVQFGIRETSDIDPDHIAVIYADGNNMGGIIQGITRLDEMMAFSAFVKKTMPEVVYSALCKNMVDRVEFTALGGDDVFIIVPARKAMRSAVEMIERYNKAFAAKYPGSNSTLSVGICIAKPNTPIKIMLEAAEDELDKAKKLVRETGCAGSLSYVIFDSYEGVSGERGRWTLLPYSLDGAKQIMSFADTLRKNGTLQTRLRNIASAFRNAESDTEASLFFEYINAKETKAENKIKLSAIHGYQLKGCYYENTAGQACCIWEDLLDLIKFGE